MVSRIRASGRANGTHAGLRSLRSGRSEAEQEPAADSWARVMAVIAISGESGCRAG